MEFIAEYWWAFMTGSILSLCLSIAGLGVAGEAIDRKNDTMGCLGSIAWVFFGIVSLASGLVSIVGVIAALIAWVKA